MANLNTPEVEQAIKAAISATVDGFREWLEHETEIVDTNTRTVLPDAEITLKKGGSNQMSKYVYPKLAQHGIFFTTEPHEISPVTDPT